MDSTPEAHAGRDARDAQGFHAPGSISFFDRDDPCLDEFGAVERQAGEIGHVSSEALCHIDAGDW